jgi:protein-S-isoprenylcysteine O-methyltransferase Ste14
MHAIRIAVGIAWIVFWVYWLIAASAANASRRRRGFRQRLAGVSALIVFLLLRLSVLRNGSLAVQSVPVGVVGVVLLAAGLAFAVWARVYLGRNWGMPMTERVEGELITTGPYRFVRNPIYTGILLGVLGTVLTTNVLGLIAVAVLIAYFAYSAQVEERNLAAEFPSTYPAYRARTKMFIPFLL